MANRPSNWLDDYFGSTIIDRAADNTKLPRRGVLRIVGLTSSALYDDPTDEETILDLSGLTPGGGYTPPTGTGFAHVTGGVQDAAAQLVNLATDTTNILPIARGGTNLTAVGAANTVLTSTGAALAFVTALTLTGLTLDGSLTLTSGGPTIAEGAGAPASSPPDGSLYLRTDGTSATTAYVRAGGTWTALGTGSGTTEWSSAAAVKVANDSGFLGIQPSDLTVNAITFSQGAAPHNGAYAIGIEARASDAVTETLILSGQDAFATATGANKFGGDVVICSGAFQLTGGSGYNGPAGKLKLRLGGTNANQPNQRDWLTVQDGGQDAAHVRTGTVNLKTAGGDFYCAGAFIDPTTLIDNVGNGATTIIGVASDLSVDGTGDTSGTPLTIMAGWARNSIGTAGIGGFLYLLGGHGDGSTDGGVFLGTAHASQPGISLAYGATPTVTFQSGLKVVVGDTLFIGGSALTDPQLSYNATTSCFVTDVGAGMAEFRANSQRSRAGIVAGSAATGTTPQTIASIAIPTDLASTSWVCIFRVVEKNGTTSTETGQVVQEAHWNGTAFVAGSGTNGIASDLSANTLTPTVGVSGGNFVVGVTPRATGATHVVEFEMTAIS